MTDIHIDLDTPLYWFMCGVEGPKGHVCGPFATEERCIKIAKPDEQCGAFKSAHVVFCESLRSMMKHINVQLFRAHNDLCANSGQPEFKLRIIIEQFPQRSDIPREILEDMFDIILKFVNAKVKLKEMMKEDELI